MIAKEGSVLVKKWDVYVVGDINVDLIVPDMNSLPSPGQEINVDNMTLNVGGGAAIFTLGLAKLGVKAAFNGIIGDDMCGKFILNELKSRSIDTSLIRISEQNKTGISIALTNENDRSFITYMGTNTELDINSVDNIQLAKHVHVTGYRGSLNHKKYIEALKKIKQTDATISLDVGWDDTGEWYEGIFEIISYVDIFFINEVEAINYSKCETAEKALKKLSQFCSNVVIKMGSKGSVSVRNGKVETAEAFKVKAIDTTGAGDSFNAGYVYAFLKGLDLKNCLICGNGCGALSVTALGGNTGFPNENELQDFINANKVLA